MQAGISQKIALRVTPTPQIHVTEQFNAVHSMKISKVYMYFAGLYKWILPPLYGIEWNTIQVFMRDVHWEPVDLQIWVCLMEYFLLYGVMGWPEASTSLVYSDHNQFCCWMQEIVLPAHQSWFFITHLHACVNLQVNCFLLHYKKIY